MARTRVLFVENDFGNVGGSVRSLHRLASSLDPDKYEIHVTFAPEPRNPAVTDFEAAGFHIAWVGRRMALSAPAPGPLRLVRRVLTLLKSWWIDDVRRCWELVRVIRARQIDLVHMNPGPMRCAMVAARLTGIPSLAHHRGRPQLGRFTRYLTRGLDASICNSGFVRDSVALQSHCRALRVVHNGILVPDELPTRPARSGPVIVAAVGRLVEWKGQHVLIQAAPRVLAAFPDVQFWIVGAPVSAEADAYERTLRRMVEELGLEDRVIFTGHVKDVDRLYREKFDIAVHTSVEGEPFGLVLIEAMAYGVPVVASDGGAVPEIIEHGESGLLHEPGNADALADALITLLSDPEGARRMAEAAFERVRVRFNMKQVVQGVESVYAEVLGRP